MKKIAVVLFSLAILGFVGWKVYQAYTAEVSMIRRTRERPSVAVEIAPIQSGSIRDVGNFTGTLKPRSLVLVAPKVSGRLERINVDVGDRLKPGQIIASLDDDEFQHQLRQAKANLDVGRANLEAAKTQMDASQRELERIKTLQKKSLISRADLDRAGTDYASKSSSYRVAKAQLEEKIAAHEISMIKLSYTKINNIWDHKSTNLIVGERFVDEGALVGSTTPIISALDISSMVGAIHVTEMDYFKIRIGQKAEVAVDALPDRQFVGSVVRIAPLIKEKSREAQIDLEIANPDGLLKPGLFIRASIRFSTHHNARVIPLSALVKRDGQEGVFLLNADQESVKFVKVQTGFAEENRVEITTPELQGSVVIQGHHLLEDGSRVSIPGRISRKPDIQSSKAGAPPKKRGSKP